MVKEGKRGEEGEKEECPKDMSAQANILVLLDARGSVNWEAGGKLLYIQS
jgi:hypothetical protein